MKITTARFYRINGRSTQVKGVESDIHLPSLIDSLDIGEDKLTYALPFTRIRKLEYPQAWDMPKYIPELKARSEKRVAESEALKAHLAKVAGWKEISERKEVPLEMSARRAMIEKDKSLDEKPDEDADAADKDGKKEKTEKKKLRRRRARTIPSDSDDPVLEETYRILADLAELAAGDEMPQGRVEWYNSIFGM
jgi:carboxyl-terminal processing protease